MIERTEHDDVTALRLTWWRSRLAGYAVHVYLIRGVLVDTGFSGVARDVADVVRERRPRGALVTHQHEDHAGNVELLARLGVPIGIDARTLAVVRASQPIGLYRHVLWRSMTPLQTPFQPFVNDALALVYAPGHSPDHHVVWDTETRTLFAGDAFLGVRVRVAHRYENPREHVQSLRAMLACEPVRVFCAHRGLLRGGALLLAAKVNWMEEMIGRIEALHAEGRNVSEIRVALFGPRVSSDWISAGDYSSDNFVRCVLRG